LLSYRRSAVSNDGKVKTPIRTLPLEPERVAHGHATSIPACSPQLTRWTAGIGRVIGSEYGKVVVVGAMRDKLLDMFLPVRPDHPLK
jgi:hypothetical protein